MRVAQDVKSSESASAAEKAENILLMPYYTLFRKIRQWEPAEAQRSKPDGIGGGNPHRAWGTFPRASYSPGFPRTVSRCTMIRELLGSIRMAASKPAATGSHSQLLKAQVAACETRVRDAGVQANRLAEVRNCRRRFPCVQTRGAAAEMRPCQIPGDGKIWVDAQRRLEVRDRRVEIAPFKIGSAAVLGYTRSASLKSAMARSRMPIALRALLR